MFVLSHVYLYTGTGTTDKTENIPQKDASYFIFLDTKKPSGEEQFL
jgi:hypothetical protein